MMSNSVSESEKEILTGCVSFYTQWFDVCVCIRVRGLHLVFFRAAHTNDLVLNFQVGKQWMLLAPVEIHPPSKNFRFICLCKAP